MYPLEKNEVTCAFGVPGSWMAGKHTGIDFRAPIGTPVYACLGGKVVHAGRSEGDPAYGKHLIIESDLNGRTVRVLYAHLDRISWFASVFARVRTGQRLGATGDTGNVTGPHLHLELRGTPYNYWSFRDPAQALEAYPLARRFRKKRGL